MGRYVGIDEKEKFFEYQFLKRLKVQTIVLVYNVNQKLSGYHRSIRINLKDKSIKQDLVVFEKISKHNTILSKVSAKISFELENDSRTKTLSSILSFYH